MLEFGCLRDMELKRRILTQFLNKLSEFPSWVKASVYGKLSEEISNNEPLSYIFASYKPVLTYKGKCELDYKKLGFDTNIYNILDAVNNNYSIGEITLSTYFSLEEIAGYFLFCTDEGFFEIPQNPKILNIAGFLAGKYRTGEYFLNNGNISETQLKTAIQNYETSDKTDKKFGQTLIDNGFITKSQLDSVLYSKDEAKKRFILDYNEIPNFKQEYCDKYKEQISNLEYENKILKTKLNQLLTMVKNDD